MSRLNHLRRRLLFIVIAMFLVAFRATLSWVTSFSTLTILSLISGHTHMVVAWLVAMTIGALAGNWIWSLIPDTPLRLLAIPTAFIASLQVAIWQKSLSRQATDDTNTMIKRIAFYMLFLILSAAGLVMLFILAADTISYLSKFR